MRRHGIDRRTMLRWSAYLAGVLALPAVPYGMRIARALETSERLPVLWLHGQSCDGNIESLLRAARPGPSELILDRLSLDYCELLMAPAGQAAHGQLTDALARYAGRYVVVVEGSVPADAGYCCTGGRAFVDVVREAAAGARAVIAAGSCAVDGGLPAAAGGVTGAVSLASVLSGVSSARYLAFPGCPVNAENITAALVQYLALGEWPETDRDGLPLFAYGAKIHASCERLPFFKQGKFAMAWGDAGHRAGWCLGAIGCQGPATRGNCSTVRFNGGTSWPVASGAPCLGCTNPGFWDELDLVVDWTPPEE